MKFPIHVLIVDSDSDFSTQICQILDQATDHEYQVSVCHRGEDAINSCRVCKYGCVLVNFTMPDMSGIQVVEEIRSILDEKTSPIIIMASEHIVEAATQAVKLQAADFFVKTNINHQSIRRSVVNAIEKGQLQRGIQERRRELMVANRELERQAVEIQRFYHTVSHEIKTPLAAAREFVSLVHDGILGPVNKEQSEVLLHATVCCDQITTQFDDLVDLTRLETGKLALDIAPTDLGDIVKRVLAIVASDAQENSILLDSRVPDSLPLVDIDAGRITQVLSNLLGNAIKFTHSGGRVRLSARLLDNGLYQLRVSDNGSGIPKDDVGSVFDRLFQVDSARTRDSQSGLGLGLSIAQEIVRGHGHSLKVQSRLNGGSLFSFELTTSMVGKIENAA